MLGELALSRLLELVSLQEEVGGTLPTTGNLGDNVCFLDILGMSQQTSMGMLVWQDVITDFFSLSPDIEHINNLMPLSGNFVIYNYDGDEDDEDNDPYD